MYQQNDRDTEISQSPTRAQLQLSSSRPESFNSPNANLNASTQTSPSLHQSHQPQIKPCDIHNPRNLKTWIADTEK